VFKKVTYRFMAAFGKILGGGIGWALGGPIGAIIGFALGAVVDDTKFVVETTGTRMPTQAGDFSASLLVLAAAVMKADGNVLKSELEYVKQFFVKHFGVAHTQEQMLLFREILKKDIPLPEVCSQIRRSMEYSSRLQLIHFLFGLSMADGQVHSSEVNVIEHIAGLLGISLPDYNSIKAMFYSDSESDYKILEITKDVSDEEVKKAYRKMAVKFHPDKVSHLGEDIQKDAKEKFQKVQRAFENIKKQRGIK
jgi:DnaJ like chaperone protein